MPSCAREGKRYPDFNPKKYHSNIRELWTIIAVLIMHQQMNGTLIGLAINPKH